MIDYGPTPGRVNLRECVRVTYGILVNERVLRLAPSVLALAGAAWSVATAALLFGVDDRTAFIVANEVSERYRQLLIILPVACGALTALGATLTIALRPRAEAHIQTAGGIVAPLLLAWAVPVLATYRAWHGQPLEFMLLLTAFGLFLERALRSFFTALPPEMLDALQQKICALDAPRIRRVPLALVLAGCTAYAVYFSYHTILEHHRLTTGSLDLGIGDNLMANALAGRYFRVPALLPDGSSMLRGHALFNIFLFLPFYAINPCSETLLIIQATLVGFAALPLYLFASTIVRRFYALILAFCYLLSPIVHGPNFYDFHFLVTAMFFHFWLYFAIARRIPWLAALAWLILIAMREDISLGLCMLGLVLALSGTRVAYGVTIAVASAVMFVIIKFVIMPAAGTWFFSDHFAGLYVPGEKTYASVIKTIVSNPTQLLVSLVETKKLTFTLHILAPLLFLPWRRPWLFVVTLAAFPSTLMVTHGPYIHNIGFQYVTHWVPYVYGGAAVALLLMNQHQGLGVRKVNSAAAAILVTAVLHSLTFGAVLQQETFVAADKKIPLKMTDEERADYAALVAVRSKIPKDAAVAATTFVFPHISNRLDAYDLQVASAHHVRHVDYLLVTPRRSRDARSTLRPLLKQEPFGLVENRGTIYLFKKGLDPNSEETLSAWRKLGVK